MPFGVLPPVIPRKGSNYSLDSAEKPPLFGIFRWRDEKSKKAALTNEL
jgi:hypothetical protein